MSSLIPPVSPDRRHWYNTEKNTAALIQSVVKSRSADKLSGDEIWSLITLTWITMGKKEVSPTHWKRLKIPALENLFNEKATASSNLSVTIDSMNLPSAVAQFAKRGTGMVNFRRTWRNSSRKWCQQNRDDLSQYHQYCFETSGKRPSADQSGGSHRQIAACGLAQSQSQSCGWSSADAPICVPRSKEMTEDVIKRVPLLKRLGKNTMPQKVHESPLRNYDEEERRAVLASKTATYRMRHNRMTTALNRIFTSFDPTTETSPAGRCDAIIKYYDGSRDLLIEAKPDADKGSIRIAIGQLFDYARHRSRQPATDLVVLTIPSPAPDYIDLLNDLGITAIWFGDESCKRIAGGQGKAWAAIANSIDVKAAAA